MISSYSLPDSNPIVFASLALSLPENRTGTIEQLAQNVEAVEKQVQLMGVKMNRNHMH